MTIPTLKRSAAIAFCLAACISVFFACKGREPDSEKIPSDFSVNSGGTLVLTGAEAESVKIPVYSDLEWTCTLQSVDWISLTSQFSSYSKSTSRYEGTVLLQLKDNDSGSEREATLTVNSGKSVVKVIIRQQDASSFVSAKAISLRGKDAVTVNTSCKGSWTVSTDADWLTLKPASGSGKSHFLVTPKDDNSMNVGERTANVVFKVGTISLTIPVNQGQTNNLIVTDDTLDVDCDGGELTVHTQYNSDYTYEIVSGKEWLSALPASKALNEKEERFVAVANTDTLVRTGLIVFTLDDIKEEVSVVQKGVDPILRRDGIGAFGVRGSTYKYIPLKNQMSRLYEGDMLSFRLLDPSVNSAVEISGIKLDAAVGDSYQIKVVSRIGWDRVLNLKYDVKVLADEEGLIRLKNSDDTWFIIKK